MDGTITIVITGVVAVGVAIYLYVQDRATDAAVETWAAARNLALDSVSERAVHAYIRQSQVLRVLGVAVGIALPGAVMTAFGTTNAPASAAWPYVGYCVGAFYGAIVLVSPRSLAQRRAELSTRRLGDYLDSRILWVQRLLAPATCLVAVAALRVPYANDWSRGLTSTIGWTGISITMATVAEVLQRRVVRRPQPYVDASLVLADDAIRGHIVQTVAGAAVGAQILAIATIAGRMGMSDVDILRRVMFLPGILGWVIALYACISIARRPRQINRRHQMSP